MPNIAALLKTEISRLSNKAARQHVAPVHTATGALRKQLLALKKQVRALEQEMAALKRSAAKVQLDDSASEEKDFRFTAKGLRSLRSRLGLSAADFGLLLQVGPQTIYNWESENARPRRAQIPAIAALRKIGKREARARLENAAAR